MNTLNGYSKSTLTDKYVLTASGGHRPINDSEFIVGTQTAATGSWTGATTDTELYDGKLITYWLPFAGSGNASLNLTFPDNTTSGAVPCYYGGTSRLTTHYGAGNTVRLTYRKNVTIGSTTIAAGWWADSNYTDGNTYTSAYCGTSAGTAAKTATCTNYKLLTNSYLHLTVVYANTSQTALTLNVNSLGAKPLYINGVVSSNTNYTLPAGTYLIYYDGINYYLRTDGYIPTLPLGYTLIKYTIDASALNEDTYYPVTFRLDPGNTSPNVRIECIVSLDSGSKPSWSTHNSGFSVRKIWETNGSKWGCSAVVRYIYVSNYEWCGSDPVRGIGQLTNSSTEYVYVRGGGVYFFYTTHNVIPVLRTSTYTIADQTVLPTTTAPDTFSPTLVTTAVLNAYKNVTVSQHTGNATDYPLVWSNQNNTNSAHANQLFKSWQDLYYNPKNKKLTTGTYVAVTGVTTPKVESSATTLIINSGTDLYLKRANDDTKSLVLNTTSFKPFDTANAKLDLGSTSAKWKNIYANNLLNIVNKAGGTDLGMIVEGSSNKIGFIIGTGNVNRGIYDFTNSKWIFLKDASTTYINDWASIGSSTKPVYFTGGKPVACGSSLAVSITGDANTVDGKHASDFLSITPTQFSQYKKGNWTKILTFTIPVNSITPSISFTWHPTECARYAWGDFNINIRSGAIIFMANWKGNEIRTLKCVGDGTTYDVWVYGTKEGYDPYGSIQVLSTYNITSYQAGSLAYLDADPTGTYTANATKYGSVSSADKLSTVSKTAWGLTYWTSGGVPTSISGNISSTGNITPSATHTYNIGSSSLVYEKVYCRYIDTDSGYNLRLCALGSEKISINATNGYVGINNTAPTHQLTVGGASYFNGRVRIDGTAASQPLVVRGIAGLDGYGTVGELYLLYGANSAIYLGNAAGYTISADGSQYSGNAATSSRATCVIDYGDTSRTIKIGYKGSGLTTTGFFAAYGPDNGDGSINIKDISVANAKAVLGVPTKTSQLTNDSGFITGGSYLPLSGGTMTGVITTATGNLSGLKFGTSHLTSLSNLLLWQSAEAIRFGSSDWDWNSWAGLKYNHPNKTIYLGLADGTTFNANAAQSGGKVKFPGVSDVYVNRLTITSTEGSVKHLQFSRGSYNYISAPSGGTIVMLPNGASASSSTGMTFTSAGFYPQTTKGYSLGTTSYRWSTVYGDCGNFTGAITSSLTTGSHLKGNQGTAIINSTAAAGYNMLARMKSTNGVFTTGAYNAAFMLYYTADSTITAGTNGTTKNVTLLDESGNTTFSGRVQSSNFKSTAATGTQPYVCTSTTCNTNLNADLLDGTHKSDLLTSVTSNATTNLSVVVGGTTKSVTDLFARKWIKSSNTITSTAQDTTANWGALNNTMHYYNSVLLTDQPSLYGLLLNFNNGTAEVHQIWMTQASGSLYHRGGNASGWSGSWRRIIDSADASSVKTWTASIKGQTWSRLCKVDYATSVVGSSYIINIKGTRSSVVYNNTYMVNTHHEGKGNVVAIGSSNYTEVTVRVCVDSTGNSYFELKDSAKSIATSTSQSVYCTLIPMGCGSVTLYTAFTSGATLDSGYTAGTELITRAIDSCIHAANFSASALTRSAEFALQKNTSTKSYMHTYISTVGTTSTGGIAYLKIGNAIATGSVDNARGILCVYGTGKSGALIKCDSTSANDYEVMLPAAAGRLVYHTTGSLIGSGTKPIYVSSVGKATASTSTIGNGSNPVYLSSGTITACSYPKSGAYFQGVPSVSSGGVTEIGRYLDFHPTNTSTLDFSARLDCGTSTTARTITLPDYPGTLLLHHGSMTRNTSEDTHAKAISDYFTTNKTTMPRNMLHSLYSPAYGNGSCAFGYLLNGYDANPFGGYFIAHYKKAWYVGIDNGSYQLYRIATAALANISSDKKPLYIDDGNLKPCLVESHTSSYAYYGTSSFNVKLTRFQIQSNLYIVNIRASIPSGCYRQKGKELYTTAVTSGGTVYTLPAGYRPAGTITSCVYAADSTNENESAANIAIFTDGKIRFHAGTTLPTWTSESSNIGLNMWYLGTGS